MEGNQKQMHDLFLIEVPVEEVGLGMQLTSIGGLLFADDCEY